MKRGSSGTRSKPMADALINSWYEIHFLDYHWRWNQHLYFHRHHLLTTSGVPSNLRDSEGHLDHSRADHERRAQIDPALYLVD